MLVNDIYNDLLNFYNKNHSNYLLGNPFFIRTHDTITWCNRLTPQRNEKYEEEYQWIIENNQYSLCINEYGVFQFYFESRINSLNKASLTFLPNPDISHQYIRFDYDKQNSIDYEHTAAHFHFGYPSSMIRLTLEKIPFPSIFIMFILHNMKIDKVKVFDRDKFYNSEIPIINNHSLIFNV